MPTRETCKNCGRINPLGFTVPDGIWYACVPIRYRDDNLCIICFDQYATENGIAWEELIKFYPVSGITHIKRLEW